MINRKSVDGISLIVLCFYVDPSGMDSDAVLLLQAESKGKEKNKGKTMSTTTIYRLTFDLGEFQQLGFDLPEPPLDLYDLSGDSKPDWTPQPVYSPYPRLKRPDTWDLAGTAAFAMDEHTVDLLEPHITQAGELLPLNFMPNGEQLLLLNVLQDVDCLDSSRSVLDSLELVVEFVEHRLPGEGLFKVPELDTTQIFVLESSERTSSFRHKVAHHDLAGVGFEAVWSDERGAIPSNLFRI